ncbi:hypothetical protein ABPG75_005763 [Micractinium tetrahymenae]
MCSLIGGVPRLDGMPATAAAAARPLVPPAAGRRAYCRRASQAAKRQCKAAAGSEGASADETAAAKPPTQQQQQPPKAGEQPHQPQRQQAEPAWQAEGPLLDTNVWAYKPAWCQPYSILATGSLVVSAVWLTSGGSPAWTAAAALPVAAWWYLFLAVYPAQFREYAEGVNAERQQRGGSGSGFSGGGPSRERGGR